MNRRNLVQLFISLVGAILILTAMLFNPQPSNENELSISVNTILLSIGCSVIAVVIINFFEYYIILPEVNILQFINSWKLVAIFETRADMNRVTNEMLKNAKEIDIAAFGSKGLLNAQGSLLKDRIRKGLRIRFLVPDKDSEFVKQRERDENATDCEIKNNIEALISWIDQANKELNLQNNQIQIKMYSCLPIESIMRIDGHLFTGPFMIKKVSQLTMAYQYKKGGQGYTYYNNYFNDIWNDQSISKKY
ncbi:hypothetical protein [Shewanella oncorhynchi]|uniref:hypothetical protein n=1 Tax=Shewanella oncorhynchi TaxID=2726434 RepID=UPI003D7A64F0